MRTQSSQISRRDSAHAIQSCFCIDASEFWGETEVRWGGPRRRQECPIGRWSQPREDRGSAPPFEPAADARLEEQPEARGDHGGNRDPGDEANALRTLGALLLWG